MLGTIASQANLAKYPYRDATEASLAKGEVEFAPELTPGSSTPGSSCAPRVELTDSALEHFGSLYGACAAMKTLFRKLERLAASNAPVMILGESGSGKELVATTLHQLSNRSKQPFIAVNCGAIPENLIESELFGHERGSFTGASRTHRGCFERAHGGTLFLDEVTEMPIDMQVRLLRVLETGKFSRVGGDQELAADVRVLAASNRDLRQAVSSGRLREDLMYRLCVIPVAVPPLRQREDDSLLLAQMFLAQLNDENREDKHLVESGKDKILKHSWPGNVRELKNVVHRAFVLCDDEVDIDIEPGPVPHQETATREAAAAEQPGPATSPYGDSFIVRIPVGMSLDTAEKALITATLKAVAGSKTKAARVLGVSLKTLYNRLHAYDAAVVAKTGREAQPSVAEEQCVPFAA